MIQLDIGGGDKSRQGFINVDCLPCAEVRIDLEQVGRGLVRLPWADCEVDEVYSSHCFEHLQHYRGLLHEIARVCKLGAKVEIRVPHWANSMAHISGHIHSLSEKQVSHWTEFSATWWSSCPRRLQHVQTQRIPSESFAEARRLFPKLTADQVMKFVQDTCEELRFTFTVVAHENAQADAPTISKHLLSKSYIVGNSWQLLDLSDQERQLLDSANWVFACNQFPQHWRTAGFRPTVWAMGDTGSPETCQILSDQLAAIAGSPELQERLRWMFVCCECKDAFDIVRDSGLPITLYTRGHYADDGQRFAKTLYEPLYHHSTGLDLLNLAMILNPGQQVRLTGCQRGWCGRHFYEEKTISIGPPTAHPFQPMWDAFSQAMAEGVDLLDCNREHSPEFAASHPIKRGQLLDL